MKFRTISICLALLMVGHLISFLKAKTLYPLNFLTVEPIENEFFKFIHRRAKG